ncbi:MAG: hypothetical protein ACFE8L_01090 [Candidatus Hodarchaeota archaeon]
MTITPEGMLDGITAAGIVLSATLFGLFSLYKAIKLKAKLLGVAALTMFFTGLLWLGPSIDLIFVLTTEKNIDPIQVYSILSYMWVAPALLVSMYLGGELIWPKGKWVIVVIFLALGIAFEMFLWFNTNHSFEFTLDNPGEDLIDASFVREHPTFLLVAIFLISTLFFLGIGFLIKAKQATGDLRRKFLFLAIGFIIFVLTGALDSILPIGVAIGFIRVVMMTYAIWLYLGLKT